MGCLNLIPPIPSFSLPTGITITAPKLPTFGFPGVCCNLIAPFNLSFIPFPPIPIPFAALIAANQTIELARSYVNNVLALKCPKE